MVTPILKKNLNEFVATEENPKCQTTYGGWQMNGSPQSGDPAKTKMVGDYGSDEKQYAQSRLDTPMRSNTTYAQSKENEFPGMSSLVIANPTIPVLGHI